MNHRINRAIQLYLINDYKGIYSKETYTHEEQLGLFTVEHKNKVIAIGSPYIYFSYYKPIHGMLIGNSKPHYNLIKYKPVVDALIKGKEREVNYWVVNSL